MGISAFPQGSLERERPPEGGGNSVSASVTQLPPLCAALAAKKGGSLPPYSPLSCGAPFAGREGSARLEETRIEGSSISLDPVSARVSDKDRTTAARASPSEIAAFW